MEFNKKIKLPVSKRVKRWVIRTVLVIAGLYLLLLVGISIYISSNQERLMGFLNDRLKQTILGELKVDKAEITVWQSFPKLGITLNNVTISDSFYHKPFLQAKSITAKAGFFDMMGSKFNVSSVIIQNAVIHTFTDAKGYTNSYVLKPQNKPKRQSKKPVVFKNLELENVTAISENAIKNKRYELRIKDADADIRLTSGKYHIELDEDILVRGLGFNLAKGYWLENQRVEAVWKLEYDTSKSTLSFGETRVKIQGQPFTFKGFFSFNAPAHFHIEASTRNIKYAAAMAILKPTTSAKISKLNLTRPIDANLLLDGSIGYKTIPFVKVDFSTKNNNFSTPVADLTECNFKGSFSNYVNKSLPRTDDNSRVTISSLTCKWGDIKLKAQNIAVVNLINPIIQFEFFSECTLPQLDEQLSSSTLKFINGSAKVYLAYNGPLIPNASLLDQLDAKFQIQNGKIVYVPRHLTLSECNGNISITGNNLLVDSFRCNLNTNHFVVNITGSNLNRVSSKMPGKATINCDIFSPAIDLTDFKVLFAGKTKTVARKSGAGLSGTTSSIDNAVERGDLFLNLKAQQLSLHNFHAGNAIITAYFKDDDWEIQKAAFLFGNGSFNLNAKVHQSNNATNNAVVNMDINRIDVKKLFYGFNNFGQTSITSANLNGIMDSKASLHATMDEKGKLVPSTINGQLYFSLKNAALINHEPLQHIQKYVFKNRDLKHLEFAELEDTFDIKNGDIYIHRMPIQSSAITMYIEGIYSFADRTDISIQVPLSTLVDKPGDDFKKIDQKKSDRPGPSIYIRAKDNNGQMKFGIDVFRKLHDKKFKKMERDSL